MAQHTDIPRDPGIASGKEREEQEDFDLFLAELGNSRELQVNRLDARKAASAVFCTLARRLSIGEDLELLRALAGFGAMLEPCDIHRGPSHARRMGRDEFLADVADTTHSHPPGLPRHHGGVHRDSRPHSGGGGGGGGLAASRGPWRICSAGRCSEESAFAAVMTC